MLKIWLMRISSSWRVILQLARSWHRQSSKPLSALVWRKLWLSRTPFLSQVSFPWQPLQRASRGPLLATEEKGTMVFSSPYCSTLLSIFPANSHCHEERQARGWGSLWAKGGSGCEAWRKQFLRRCYEVFKSCSTPICLLAWGWGTTNPANQTEGKERRNIKRM